MSAISDAEAAKQHLFLQVKEEVSKIEQLCLALMMEKIIDLKQLSSLTGRLNHWCQVCPEHKELFYYMVFGPTI